LRPIVGPLFGLNSWNGTSALDEEPEDELKLPKGGGVTKEEERFLSAQADHFAGANWKKEVGLLRSK
jgi:hypothetical protein